MLPFKFTTILMHAGQERIKKSEEANEPAPSASIFSWLFKPFSSQGVERAVVAGDVHVVSAASTEKKELTEKQKELLARMKSRNNKS